MYVETATHAPEHNLTSRLVSDCKCAVLHFGSNVISGNKCVRREPIVLWDTASTRRLNITFALIGLFSKSQLPNSFFVILTRFISSQSPCNPISQLSLVADSHTAVQHKLGLSWFCRWNVEIVVRWPLGYFGRIYVSRLVSVWPRKHLHLLLTRNIREYRNIIQL